MAATTGDQPVIVYDIHELVKLYPGQSRPANSDISLQIHEGEIFGLLGYNGAAKTTLVRQMVNRSPDRSLWTWLSSRA